MVGECRLSCYGDGLLRNTVCPVTGMGGWGVQFDLLWGCVGWEYSFCPVIGMVVWEYSLFCYGDGWFGNTVCPVMGMMEGRVQFVLLWG